MVYCEGLHYLYHGIFFTNAVVAFDSKCNGTILVYDSLAIMLQSLTFMADKAS